MLEIRVGDPIVVWKLDRLARFTRDQNAIAILSAYSNVTAAFAVSVPGSSIGLLIPKTNASTRRCLERSIVVMVNLEVGLPVYFCNRGIQSSLAHICPVWAFGSRVENNTSGATKWIAADRQT